MRGKEREAINNIVLACPALCDHICCNLMQPNLQYGCSHPHIFLFLLLDAGSGVNYDHNSQTGYCINQHSLPRQSAADKFIILSSLQILQFYI